MNKLLASAIVTVLCVFSAATFAEGKIAVLNIQAAIQNTDFAQKKYKALTESADFAELRAKYETIEAELKKLSEDFEKNSVTWDDGKKSEFVKKRDFQLADRKLILEKLQSEERTATQTIARELGNKPKDALGELIKLEGIGLVLGPQSVIHADESYDITAKLTDRINKMK